MHKRMLTFTTRWQLSDILFLPETEADYSFDFIVGTKADIIYLMCCDIIFFTIAAIFVLLGSLASLRIISNLIAITV